MEINMKKQTKFNIAVGITAAAATAHIINRLVFSSAVSKKITHNDNTEYYKWRFGNVAYTVCGEGSPLLLVHDLCSSGSSYEWKNVINSLSKEHTVYTIDLLGCGHSDKPNITYTTYMYTQLINDFVLNVINQRTDVIATGTSAPLTIMAACNNPLTFNKIMLVNPQSIKAAMVNPTNKTDFRRILLNSPILGTSIYNICMSKFVLRKHFSKNLFYNPKNITSELVSAGSENAHLSGAASKFLYTSTVCHYTTANISRAVKSIPNSIYIIYGRDAKNISTTLKEYTQINPSIMLASVDNSKQLPQLENPYGFLKAARILSL